jgi:dGTP triphosphohydrolase
MLNIPYTTSKEIFSEKFNIKPQAFHLLKEVYAPIIMNDSELKKFFPNYVIGNTELQVIRIQENDTIQTVEGFFSKKYKELKSQNLNPEQILNSMIEITKKISEGLETQHNLMSNIPPQEYEIKGLYNPIIYKE